MASGSKRGSSRRKGDEFQDLTALRLVLELYIEGADFQAFLEYEKASAIDDIVIFSKNTIRAIQAKYAIDPLDVYLPDDFGQTSGRACFGPYAQGWQNLRLAHPNEKLTVELVSNRGRDSTLKPVINSDGCLSPEFVDGRVRGETQQFRKNLVSVCAFGGVDAEAMFQEFLNSFRFQLGQRPLQELQSYIQGELLDHKLGISDRTTFFELKELIERHAIELHDPITQSHIGSVLLRAHNRLLLPQVFPVDREHFVALTKFKTDLSHAIDETNGDYVVVTGLPGSGKSTCLSDFFDDLETSRKFAICRYYCFVRPSDDASRLRLQAEALRTNILTILHSNFKDILDRRHDYGEAQFVNALAAVGEHLSSHGRKLIVLLDGLDHAERDPLVQQSVLHALPTALPPGIVFVVGTQELKHWEPLALREARKKRHVEMPLFSRKETELYLVKKHKLTLDDPTLDDIHKKSNGLPLYLWYVARWLNDHSDNPAALKTMPEAIDGDIRKYYERLWANLEREGMAYAHHLCCVFAALRFPVAEEEVAAFQDALSSLQVADAFRAVCHLLRRVDGTLTIFHESFRVFVNSKLDGPTRKRIARAITERLKTERGSGRWFTNVFRYSLEGGDDDFILREVNRQFVDFAMQRCRPAKNIFEAIEVAGEAGARRKDLVALARLGSLNYRTRERLNHQFDYSALAHPLLNLGRIDDVLSFCCDPHESRLLVHVDVAMQVMIWCAKVGQREVGERLFGIFLRARAYREVSNRSQVQLLSQVLGIYSGSPVHSLSYLARFNWEPDILERREIFAPGHAPQLDAFLESYYLHRAPDSWKRLKRIRRLFPNALVRFLLLRLVAQHGSKEELTAELNEYLALYPSENLEISGLGVLAGMPLARVRGLSGPIVLPHRTATGLEPQASREEHLDRFKWTAIILGYEDDPATVNRVAAHIGSARTMWSGFLRFQLLAGVCLGRFCAGKPLDYFAEAKAALTALAEAGTEDEPQEMEVLRACRPLLPKSLFELTKMVGDKCPDKMDNWRDELLALRQSEMWTSHWGFGESTANYEFELSIWEALAGASNMSMRLLPILQSCAITYTEEGPLKAGSRSHHFLWLAAIAARCGWRTDAEKWIDKGISCSLTYGYHKDVTIDNLVDVLQVLSRRQPGMALGRCAAILEMVKWMPTVTDGRSTKHFNQSVFDIVLETSREAAFAVIRYFRDHVGRWKMQDCLEEYLCSITGGDLEVLWTLKDAFAPDFQERGRHPKQVIHVARYLCDLATRLEPTKAREWNDRFTDFVRIHFDPGCWPDDVWAVVEASETRPRLKARDPYSSGDDLGTKGFTLDGRKQSRSEIEEKLNVSLDSFCRTYDQLRAEKDHFFDYKLLTPAFRAHAMRATSLEQVRRLYELAKASKDLFHPESFAEIGHRLYDFGQGEDGFQCLLLAYQQSPLFSYDRSKAQPYLFELCQRDKAQVTNYLADWGASALQSDYGGFDSPCWIARYFDACGDVNNLTRVFEDYLQHCQELFAHLPHETQYDWLRDYHEQGKEESAEFVGFLIDLLDGPEIDEAGRLLHVLGRLGIVRNELVGRLCCERYQSASPLLRQRLAVLLETLAWHSPGSIGPHLDNLLSLLGQPSFQSRMLLITVCRLIARTAELSPEIAKMIVQAESEYVPVISRPVTPLFDIEPSHEFFEFLRKGTLFDFHDRVKGVSELLRIDPGTVYAKVERAFRDKGWTVEAAEAQRKKDWSGWAAHDRAVMIITSFQLEAWEHLQAYIHETLINGTYDRQTINSCWNVVRGCDPELIVELSHTKPPDIPALNIHDAQAWLGECRRPTGIKFDSLPESGWTSLYEAGVLSQTEDSHPKFVMHFNRCSILVAPELSSHSQEWPSPENWTRRFPGTQAEENLTVESARERLLAARGVTLDVRASVLPVIVSHINSELFLGFRRLACIHPAWIAHHELEFRGFDLYSREGPLTRLEQWQEGYEDEAYSRAVLSAGMRYLVRNDWLNQLLRDTERALIVCRMEDRRYFESYWKREPTATQKGIAYSVYIKS